MRGLHTGLARESGPGSRGFTLLEVMVGLVIAVVVLGGVMGGISSALRYGARIKERAAVQPILEAAAQEILAFPERLGQRTLVLETLEGGPQVSVLAQEVLAANGDELPNRSGRLYRVLLRSGAQTLEFSVFAPKSELE